MIIFGEYLASDQNYLGKVCSVGGTEPSWLYPKHFICRLLFVPKNLFSISGLMENGLWDYLCPSESDIKDYSEWGDVYVLLQVNTKLLSPWRQSGMLSLVQHIVTWFRFTGKITLNSGSFSWSLQLWQVKPAYGVQSSQKSFFCLLLMEHHFICCTSWLTIWHLEWSKL